MGQRGAAATPTVSARSSSIHHAPGPLPSPPCVTSSPCNAWRHMLFVFVGWCVCVCADHGGGWREADGESKRAEWAAVVSLAAFARVWSLRESIEQLQASRAVR